MTKFIKLITVVAALSVAVVLFGCGNSVQSVTFNGFFFDDPANVEACTSELEELGCTDVVANGDGTYTANMPKDVYDEFITEFEGEMETYYDGLVGSPELPMIKSIEYDDTYENITITTTNPELGLDEMFLSLGCGVMNITYQQLTDAPLHSVVTIVDEAGNVLDTSVYPDVLEEMEEEASASETH